LLGVEQLPAPLQNATGVNVEPLQEADPQVTLVEAWVQAPAPLQVPVLPQVPLAAQRPCGSLTALATLAQVPALPATLQAWQVPQLAVPQQTPSTQKPLPHSWLARQATPLLLTGRQLPAAVQYEPTPPLGMQSVSAVQVLLQAVAPHL